MSEALDLKVRDLSLDTVSPTVRVRSGKSGKTRLVPVHPELHGALNSALAYGDISQGRIIEAHTTTAWRCVKTAVKRAEELGAIAPGKQVSTHTLRHRYGDNYSPNMEGMETIPMTTEEVSEGIAYYRNLRINPDITLPLREGPIRFGMLRRNDLSSNSWRVWTTKAGDIYIACRDHMTDQKISLHQSGKQQIAFTSESGIETTAGSRFVDQWWEPEHTSDSKVTSTFTLLFPSWALTLTQAIRDESPRIWNRNQVFIEAAESPITTVVSFIISDEDLTMRFNTEGESPSFPLSILPARSGKKLWVVASHVPEGNMMSLAEQCIGDFNSSINEDVKDKVRDLPSGHVLGMCATGRSAAGGAFMMPFSVEMHWGDRGSAAESALADTIL